MALSSACKQLLLNRGRSYVYSTALPVPMVAGALAALRVATQQVWAQMADHMASHLLCVCALQEMVLVARDQTMH